MTTQHGAGGRTPRKRGGGRAIVAWIVGGLLVFLGVAFVLVDNGLRAGAEAVVQTAISEQLPDNVSGRIEVSIGGPSVIWQYLTGSFDEIELDAPTLSIDGVPVAAHLVARGVPTDLTAPVRRVSAVVSLDQSALNAILQVPGAASELTLGDGSVGFDAVQSILGFPVSYHLTAKPKAAGTTVLLTPIAATVTAGPVGVDATWLVNAILGEKPLPVCVAEKLPKGVEVTAIAVTPSAATVTFAAENLTLDQATLTSTGNCG